MFIGIEPSGNGWAAFLKNKMRNGDAANYIQKQAEKMVSVGNLSAHSYSYKGKGQ